jgi:hypothetical protein
VRWEDTINEGIHAGVYSCSMILRIDPRWRGKPPSSNKMETRVIPPEAVESFFSMILKISAQGHPKLVLEHFKRHFSLGMGSIHVDSSSTGWAQSDLQSRMEEAADDAVQFIDSLYDGFQSLVRQNDQFAVPDDATINAVLRDNNVGYTIDSDELRLLDQSAVLVAVDPQPLKLSKEPLDLVQASLNRSEELLEEGHWREAVQESLWLLETISTAFDGYDTKAGSIGGRYFNKIVKDLRSKNAGKTFYIVLGWVTNVHGYLSAPAGGGVRHGLDLNKGLDLSENEARLFCNLIRSFTGYLISEHRTQGL